MADIVERLHFDAARCEVDYSKGVAGNIEEAAAEIERLRTALGFHVNELQEARRQAIRDATEIERLHAAIHKQPGERS